MAEQKPALPPALLRRIGEGLYAYEWQNRLARDLGVADRVMRRWLSGQMLVPPGVAADLYRMVRQRSGDLLDIAREMDPFVEGKP